MFHWSQTRIMSSLCEDFWPYLAQFFLEWEMFWTKVVKKIKTHILFSVNLFFNNCTIDEIMWRIILQPTGHRWQGGASALHAGYPILQTHTFGMCNTFLLFYCNNGCINAPHCYMTCTLLICCEGKVSRKGHGYKIPAFWALIVCSYMYNAQ